MDRHAKIVLKQIKSNNLKKSETDPFILMMPPEAADY